ncbi:MAG: tyrosine-type recombinase/integrase [Phycisphaera sp.]|nr:MAG: tyrosine-type recombinase/integrase [Phycisphaera sp.]
MFYEPVWEYQGHKLVKRPDSKSLYITWCRPGSRKWHRRSTKTNDLDLAKERLVEFTRARISLGPTPPERLDLIGLLTSYVKRTNRGKRRGTAEATALKHWTAFLTSHDIASVAELTRAAQDRYIEWRRRDLRSRGYAASNGTLSRELRVMRAALNDAWREGLLTHPPYVQSVIEPPPRQHFLFPGQVDRLIGACEKDHLLRFVMVALHTLQRPGAILTLHANQIDFESNRIDFLATGGLQTRKHRPVVPITRTLRPVLEEAIADSYTGHVIEYLGRPVTHVRRSFAAACKAAGLEDVSPYTLRHTGATLMLAIGVPIRQVAGMLGHSEQRTTEFYGKHHVAFLKDATDALDTLFGPDRDVPAGWDDPKHDH